MATVKSREKGTVSLTQIKVLAKELKLDYPKGTKYKDSRLVYNVSNGWGQVKLVGTTYRLRAGEHELADEEKFQALVKGFYNQNIEFGVHDQALNYLSNGVQKLVYGLTKAPVNKATKEEVLKLYAKYEEFQEFYKTVSDIQGEYNIDFSIYDFMTADMYRANERVTAYMKKLGKENNLVINAIGKPDGFYMRYEVEGFNPRKLFHIDVYYGEVNKFLNGKNLEADKIQLLNDLFRFLYHVNKEEFVGLLASGTGAPYIGIVKEFMNRLEKGMATINLDGLLKFKVGAIKLLSNKESVRALGKQK